jgi:O-antigen/teichoic acid export membrane protein
MNYFNKLVALKRLFLLDRRVLHSLIFRASQALVGILTILMITRFFTKAEQGYYYTFNSILALQIIFEMGLSFIILQYTGHEFATIQWEEGKLAGPLEALGRFQAFFSKAVQAYMVIALVVFFLVWPIGIFFFSRAAGHSGFAWSLPWFLLCMSTGLNIVTLPFLSVIEGSGLVVRINQFKTIQNTIGAIAMWIGMMGGAQLYSIALDPLICFVITALWLRRYYSDLLIRAYYGLVGVFKQSVSTSTFPWMKEVWPMQWRIAISWISGYFLGQIYTPILFYYHDAASAGKFGASMAVCNMLSLFSITFLNAYNPELCRLIASNKYQALFALFKQVFLHALIVALLMAIAIMVTFYIPIFSFITDRFLSPLDMGLLLLGSIINYIIGAIALFLRAFKREPFVWVSLIGAIFNAVCAWWFGKIYGTTGIVLTFLLLNVLFGLPTALWLWRRNTVHLWKDRFGYGFY